MIDFSECSLFASGEEDFHNQVDRMTCPLDASQTLSAATPVITCWVHEQSGYGSRNGGYAWAQQHRFPLTKANLAMATTKWPICQLRDQPWAPDMAPLPRVISSYPVAG